jgi:lipopolysaccharide transport system ATP-binding protein
VEREERERRSLGIEKGNGASDTGDRAERSPIAVRNLSKSFRLYEHPWQRALDWFLPFGVPRYRDFWALRGIDFEVRRGTCLGIIGNNGAGKSTLLKLLTGTLHPTSGSLSVEGRLFSILELGGGFHPELSARENVRHAGRLLALPPGYVESRLPEIEQFADLGDFFERPFKTYSSGMQIRLAFSLFAFLEPEVLFLDEALSVGDIFFQQKSYGRVRDLLANGTTAVFVSHDMAAIQNLCQEVILLREGEIAFRGAPEVAVSRYFASVGSRRSSQQTGPSAAAPSRLAPTGLRAAPIDVSVVRAGALTHRLERTLGSGLLDITGARVVDELGRETLLVGTGETLTFQLALTAREAVADPTAGIHLYDRLGNLVFATGSRHQRHSLPSLNAGEEMVVEIGVRFELGPGEYTFSLGCSEPSSDPNPNIGFVHFRCEGLGPIVVREDPEPLPRFYGLARLPVTIWASKVHG